MPVKSGMSSILGQIETEHPKLFTLEFGKIAKSDFVYTLASTTNDQSTPNMVKMYVTDHKTPDLPLNLEKLRNLTLFTL